MPRSPTYNPTCTINFQTDERTRAALHAVARRQERSASAVIRLAIHTWLEEQGASAAQQHSKRAAAVAPRLVPVMDGGTRAGFLLNLGRRGVEAFDNDEKSLGVFPNVLSAWTAVKQSAVPVPSSVEDHTA